ncbi:MAG: TonB-dependent receptor [Bacteroidota bacterium]
MVALSRCLALTALAALSLLIAHPAFAQEQERLRSFSGTVLDAGTGAALPGVNVILDAERGLGGATDRDGRFAISGLPPEAFIVRFSYIGYEADSMRIDLQQESVRARVTLDAVAEIIAEVIVEGETELLEQGAQAISILDADALEDARGQTIGETIGALPGVTTLSTGPSIVKPVVRGLHSDRLVILNNGVRHESQQWGAEHAPEIDPFSPDRIEVIRGAAGVEHGVGAIGGVVRLEEAPLPTQVGEVSGQLSLHSFSNSRQGVGSLEMEGAPLPGLGVRVQGSLRRAGDAHTPDYVLGNTAFFERGANATVGLERERWGVEAHGSVFATDIGIYRGSHFNTLNGLDTVLELGRPPVDYDFSYEIDAPKQDIQHYIGAVHGHVDLGRDGTIRVEGRYGFQQNERAEFDADRIGGRDPLERASFELTLQTHTLDLKARTTPTAIAGGDGFAVVGVSGMLQRNLNTQVGYFIPNFRAYTGGVFARGEWVRGPLALEAGTRLDYRWLRAFPRVRAGGGETQRIITDYVGLTGVLGATYRFGTAWSLGANVATAWRPPSVNELYARGIHHGTAQYEVGDPNVGSERALEASLTLRHQTPTRELEFSSYVNRINDYLYLRPINDLIVTNRGVFPEFLYTQDTAVIVGFDGVVTQGLGRFTLGATVSVLRGTNLTRDEALLGMPADRLELSAGVDLGSWGVLRDVTAETSVDLVREQDRFPTRLDEDGVTVIPVDYVEPPEGYALLGFDLGGEIAMGPSVMRVSLSVDNLLDTRYRDYLSRYRYFALDPGRNVVLRLALPFGA